MSGTAALHKNIIQKIKWWFAAVVQSIPPILCSYIHTHTHTNLIQADFLTALRGQRSSCPHKHTDTYMWSITYIYIYILPCIYIQGRSLYWRSCTEVRYLECQYWWSWCSSAVHWSLSHLLLQAHRCVLPRGARGPLGPRSASCLSARPWKRCSAGRSKWSTAALSSSSWAEFRETPRCHVSKRVSG